jgi:hypothetical protein
MPKLFAGLDPENPAKGRHLTLTDYQYELMRRWSEGDFEADWPGSEPEWPPFDQVPPEDQPEALDRAALDSCIGGPFFPGIEASYPMAQAETYESPFRIRKDKKPGDLTAGMAVPWQADFLACSTFYWPAQRPNSVTRDGTNFHPWVPDDFDVMRQWADLNFVLKDGDRYLEE